MASDKQDFLRFVNTLENLHFNKKGERVRPHKLIMLLAVATLFENGTLKDNRIYLDDSLTQTFTDIFERYRLADDLNQPNSPFFHLKKDGFWHHKILQGMEESYQKLGTSGSYGKRIRDHIEYAYLSDYAYSVLTNPISRTKIIYLIQGTLKADTL
jgi:predicted restriction endonuclease